MSEFGLLEVGHPRWCNERDASGSFVCDRVPWHSGRHDEEELASWDRDGRDVRWGDGTLVSEPDATAKQSISSSFAAVAEPDVSGGGPDAARDR